jgi:hypothetical protein
VHVSQFSVFILSLEKLYAAPRSIITGRSLPGDPESYMICNQVGLDSVSSIVDSSKDNPLDDANPTPVAVPLTPVPSSENNNAAEIAETNEATETLPGSRPLASTQSMSMTSMIEEIITPGPGNSDSADDESGDDDTMATVPAIRRPSLVLSPSRVLQYSPRLLSRTPGPVVDMDNYTHVPAGSHHKRIRECIGTMRESKAPIIVVPPEKSRVQLPVPQESKSTLPTLQRVGWRWRSRGEFLGFGIDVGGMDSFGLLMAFAPAEKNGRLMVVRFLFYLLDL